MQQKTPALTTVICGLALLPGCSSPPRTAPATQPTHTTGRWPFLPGISTKPAQIEVESATRFTCNGVRCQLLGVRESSDPVVQAKATEFAKRWFARIGNYISFYNGTNPLVA